jgi:hypothetical protein
MIIINRLFVGGPLNGKKLFMKHVCREWIHRDLVNCKCVGGKHKFHKYQMRGNEDFVYMGELK